MARKQIEFEKFVDISSICYKSRNSYVAHEEEKTQNKYKLVLCVDKYIRRERGREKTKIILYIYLYV